MNLMFLSTGQRVERRNCTSVGRRVTCFLSMNFIFHLILFSFLYMILVYDSFFAINFSAFCAQQVNAAAVGSMRRSFHSEYAAITPQILVQHWSAILRSRDLSSYPITIKARRSLKLMFRIEPSKVNRLFAISIAVTVLLRREDGISLAL